MAPPPPSRIRSGPEDVVKTEPAQTGSSNTKERSTSTAAGGGAQFLAPQSKGSRNRQAGAPAAAAAASGKEVAVVSNAAGGAGETAAGDGSWNGPVVGGGAQETGGTGIAWSTFDLSILHAYRHAYRLSTPSSFRSPLNQMILSNPGIGRASPTMTRPPERRRIGHDQLALAVRKHFNGLGIQEAEVVVDFLYKVRWQNKEFRMRFGPRSTRS